MNHTPPPNWGRGLTWWGLPSVNSTALSHSQKPRVQARVRHSSALFGENRSSSFITGLLKGTFKSKNAPAVCSVKSFKCSCASCLIVSLKLEPLQTFSTATTKCFFFFFFFFFFYRSTFHQMWTLYSTQSQCPQVIQYPACAHWTVWNVTSVHMYQYSSHVELGANINMSAHTHMFEPRPKLTSCVWTGSGYQ